MPTLIELNMLQNRAVTLEEDFSPEELHCYNLPYGVIGLISHLLTYYTIICLCYGRRPLWPFGKVQKTWLNLVLPFVGTALCTWTSITTIIKCKNTWQLLVIAVWKLSMSLLNGLTALHVAIMVYNAQAGKKAKTQVAAWWIVLYIPGMFAGMIGLMNLVVKVAHQIPVLIDLTIAFWCTIGGGIVGGIICMVVVLFTHGSVPSAMLKTGAFGTLATLIFFSALYSDWSLGIMLGNHFGTPSKDNAPLYWIYFVAKRLTMFSM